MGLMTEVVARTKKCKKREKIAVLVSIAEMRAEHASRKWLPRLEGEIEGKPTEANYCEGRACAHWNPTTEIARVPLEDRDKDGYVKMDLLKEAGCGTDEEYFETLIKGYCGFSPPIEELANLKTDDERGIG